MGPVTTIPPHPHPPAQPEARRTGVVVDGVVAGITVGIIAVVIGAHLINITAGN